VLCRDTERRPGDWPGWKLSALPLANEVALVVIGELLLAAFCKLFTAFWLPSAGSLLVAIFCWPSVGDLSVKLSWASLRKGHLMRLVSSHHVRFWGASPQLVHLCISSPRP